MPPKRNNKAKGGTNGGLDDEESGEIDVDFMDNMDNEYHSVVSESDAPLQKDRNFEFTDSFAMMRISRMIICLQIMALVNESPSIQLPIVFRIVCRGLLYYIGRFYSRPIIDIIYFLQWIQGAATSLLISLNIPTAPSSIEIVPPSYTVPNAPETPSIPSDIPHRYARMLSASSYAITHPKPKPIAADVVFLNDRSWHSIKMFSHFFLSALFAILAVSFTLKFWEVRDYTDRREVREWLRMYIADGWWRRGLFKVTYIMMQAMFYLILFILGIFVVAREINLNSIPEAPMIGTVLAIFTCITVLTFILGWMAIRSAEHTFIRYVSQNVSYTSAIILKRIVKAKVNVGILFMLIIYMPALFSFAQSFFIITDWNDTLALKHRRSVNYYVPCYFMAFPPFTEPHRDPATCPLVSSISTNQPMRDQGYYRDRSILACDSYLGIIFFTTGLFFFVFLIVSYCWLIFSFIQLASKELKGSRWVNILETLISIRNEQKAFYDHSFNITQRYLLDLEEEFRHQLKYIASAGLFIVTSSIYLTLSAVQLAMAPVVFLTGPCRFFAARNFKCAMLIIAQFITSAETTKAISNPKALPGNR